MVNMARDSGQIFFKHMGFGSEPSVMAVTEYGLYCKVSFKLLFAPSLTSNWEDETLPKIEELLLSPNGLTIIAAYKARRYSFPKRILIQPKKLIICLFITFVFATEYLIWRFGE